MCARDNDAAAERWQQLPPDDRIEAAVEGLRMLADPTRLRLLWLLSGDELDVSTLAERLGVARPAVSQHLAKLRLVGLITQRRDGRRVLSRARDHHVAELIEGLIHDAGHRLAERAGGPGATPSS